MLDIRKLQKVYRQLRLKDAIIIFLATVAVLHVLFELTIYRESMPAHEGIAKKAITSIRTRQQKQKERPEIVTGTEELPPLPDKESEAQRAKVRAGQGKFRYRDPKEEWKNPAQDFLWCNPRVTHHKGMYSPDECLEWLIQRGVGPGQGIFHIDKRRGTRNPNPPEGRKRHRIALVVPWTGTNLPAWDTYFLSSVAGNADIADWLFVAKQGQFNPPSFLPSNLKIIWVDDFEVFFTDRLGMPFELGEDTRRFADLKPTYGHALEPELRGYTHWAFGDVDVIYGKISRMVTEWELDYYDVISFLGEDASHPFNSGPFTVFRNTALGRNYWRAPDFDSKLPHPHVSHKGGQWAFDERLSSDVLWNFDGVRVLYSLGRLFNDLCSTPSDWTYQWKDGSLKRTHQRKDFKPMTPEQGLGEVEEGIGLHFAMSKMSGPLNIHPRKEVSVSSGFNITLTPDFWLKPIEEY